MDTGLPLGLEQANHGRDSTLQPSEEGARVDLEDAAGDLLDPPPFGAVIGVVHTVIQMIETGVVWPMTELEADDALASAAQLSAGDERVEKVCIWTPDKDLAQCVRGDRVVQVDRRGQQIRNAEGVRQKFGLATLRTDTPLFRDVDELRWRGPTDAFAECVEHLGDVRLLERRLKAQDAARRTT
jgi:hypothetical protein